ncbi:dipeptidyl aminopeptidase [Trichuris trichiura]|uniref:Prolyl endopeptidase n=1 Tax=Trichuris trichiura TaxID=36087 RepID=A0A077ZGR9_TRITR|nr:dipeptidyl aminopeptidase [Trichuris trichiura]
MCLLAFLCTLLIGTWRSFALIPREEFFGRSEIYLLRVDAQVRRLSYLSVRNSTFSLCVRELPFLKSHFCRRMPIAGVSDCWWMNDGQRMLFYHGSSVGSNPTLFTMDVLQKGPLKVRPALAHLPAGSFVIVLGFSHIKVDSVLIGIYGPNSESFDAYALNLNTMQKTLIFKSDGYHKVFFDYDFRPILAMNESSDGWTHYFRIRSSSDDNDTDRTIFQRYKSLSVEGAVSTYPLHFSNDNKIIYWQNSEGRDKAAVTAEHLDTHFTTVIYEPTMSDVDAVSWHPITFEPLIVEENYLKPEVGFVHDSIREDYDFLRSFFEPDLFTVVRFSENMLRWLVMTYSDVNPGSYYLYTKESGFRSVFFLLHLKGSLLRHQLAVKRPLEIESRDGFRQVCYLTMPLLPETNSTGRSSVPTIIWVHGGPHSRVYWSYDPVSQFFASRGYAVLDCNFRGSVGYGRSYLKAGFGEWGGKMQDDITDAALWALRTGITDPTRLAIGGASYGGYSVLCGLIFTPELYACGIDMFGPTNLVTTFQSMPISWLPMRNSIAIRLGATVNTSEGDSFLRSRSPYFKARNISQPLLVLQGLLDDRVLPRESDQLIEALGDSGTPVTYLLFPYEGHGLMTPINRVAFFAVAEKFLHDCLNGTMEPMDKELEDVFVIFETFPLKNDSIEGT